MVLDAIPEIMNGLRLIWILSRHYNSDERMASLMECIAWELSERVAKVVNLCVLFKSVGEFCIYIYKYNIQPIGQHRISLK